MTTIFAAIFLIAIIIAGSLIAVLLNYHQKLAKVEKLPDSFKSAAAAFNLSITKQEALGNYVIGIDEKHNKLLFLEARGDKNDGYLVGLNELKGCAVKREYGAIHADSFSGSSLETYINKFALKLEYKNSTEPTILTFYDREANPETEMRERTHQAYVWQSAILKALAKISKRPQYIKNAGKEELITKQAL